MKILFRVAFLSCVSAASLSAPPQAQAENLFNMLFGNKSKQQALEPWPLPPQTPARIVPKVSKPAPAPVPIAKISSPTYNSYKTAALEKVDFSRLNASLRAAPQLAGFEPAAEMFRQALDGLQGFDLLAEKDIAKALVDYYSANPDFIWVTDADSNSRASEAGQVLAEAESYGLVAADYAVAAPRANKPDEDKSARLAELMRFEMALSARVMRYVQDAQNGRINPNLISDYYDFPRKPIDLADVLKTLSHTLEVRTYLESRHPGNPEFQALRAELARLTASSAPNVTVDPKLRLKPGGTSPELPKLLAAIARDFGEDKTHDEVLSRNQASETYVPELEPVIRAAQEKAGLEPDGVIGPRTVAAIAGTTKADRIEKVVAAMEQLRWLPSDLGSPRVFVNQPAFTASYIEGGQTQLTMRTVIGSVSSQTSFFFRDAERVEFNPYWGVPQSIIVNEMLPRLRRDPGYLDRAGYEVIDAKGKRIPSSSVDWKAYGGKIPYSVRQAPSEANALGELKILFPNKHAIYMHDTPSKELFKRDVRAFSHGCIRLQNPRAMAAALLGTSVEDIAQKLKQGQSSQKVTRNIPVYVAYFTAWPDDSGEVKYFVDIYDRDSKLKTAMEKTTAARLPGRLGS